MTILVKSLYQGSLPELLSNEIAKQFNSQSRNDVKHLIKNIDLSSFDWTITLFAKLQGDKVTINKKPIGNLTSEEKREFTKSGANWWSKISILDLSQDYEFSLPLTLKPGFKSDTLTLTASYTYKINKNSPDCPKLLERGLLCEGELKLRDATKFEITLQKEQEPRIEFRSDGDLNDDFGSSLKSWLPIIIGFLSFLGLSVVKKFFLFLRHPKNIRKKEQLQTPGDKKKDEQ